MNKEEEEEEDGKDDTIFLYIISFNEIAIWADDNQLIDTIERF